MWMILNHFYTSSHSESSINQAMPYITVCYVAPLGYMTIISRRNSLSLSLSLSHSTPLSLHLPTLCLRLRVCVYISLCVCVYDSLYFLSISQWVFNSIYLSDCLSVCLVISLFLCLSFWHSVCIPFCISSSCQLIYFSVCSPLYFFACLSVGWSVSLFVCLTHCLLISLPICLSLFVSRLHILTDVGFSRSLPLLLLLFVFTLYLLAEESLYDLCQISLYRLTPSHSVPILYLCLNNNFTEILQPINTHYSNGNYLL